MTTRPELLDATDEQIDDAVQFADLMVLRGLLYQLTGDEALKATNADGSRAAGMGGAMADVVDPEDIALLRASAAQFLKRYRDSGATDLDIGPLDRLQQSLALAAGREVPPSEYELWIEELALNPFARGVESGDELTKDKLDQFFVVVIGAGMGGLNAAVQLQHTGIPFVVLEKNVGVGGTWHENRYPGARVDVTSRSYGHIFSVDFEWTSPYCQQAENEKYFNWIADHFDIRRHIEFDTEVTSVIWDDDRKVWKISAQSPSGPRTWDANAVISAVGLFGRPSQAEVSGAESFTGEAFHTARWPDGIDLEGRKVAVIGSGCTSYQMVPVLRKSAAHTYLFQRTASWVFDMPGYLDAYPPQVGWLDRNFPFYPNFVRFRLAWRGSPETTVPRQLVDPDFDDEFAVSAVNKKMRDDRIAFIENKLKDHPELIEKMIPDAPVWSSRPVLVDPNYNIFDAIVSDNVTLVTEPIERITETGIRTTDGTQHEVDTIVYATGFKTNEFLWPMEVRGRHGQSIESLWEPDGARAYLGAMMPGFPNMFLLYGPNTNPLGGLGVATAEEMITRFAIRLMTYLIESGKKAVDVRTEAYWRYNQALDETEATRIYHDRRAHNYYKNSFGRSATNNPFDARLSWNWLRDPTTPRDAGDDPVQQARLAIAHEVARPYLGEDLIVE